MAATIRPNGRNQFLDLNGNPLAGGLIETFQPGTSTHKPTYADAGMTTPLSNPIVLDASGQATIYWSGSYRLTVSDSTGVAVGPSVDPLSSDADTVIAQIAAGTLTYGNINCTGYILAQQNIVTETSVVAAEGTLTTSAKFYLGALNGTTPVINFDDDDYLIFDRTINRFSFHVAGTSPLVIDNNLLTINGPANVSNDAGDGLGGQIRYYNTNTGLGPATRVNTVNGMEWVNAAYSAVNMTLADTGNLTTRGLLYGRGGGNGLGQVIVQNGGAPSGGADGDLCLIW